MKTFTIAFMFLCAVVCMTGCAALEADAKAVFPVPDKVEATIATDLAAHDDNATIEKDVAQDLAGQTGVDVVVAIQAATTELLTFNILPPSLVPLAQTLVSSEAAKQAAGTKLRIGTELPFVSGK